MHELTRWPFCRDPVGPHGRTASMRDSKTAVRTQDTLLNKKIIVRA